MTEACREIARVLAPGGAVVLVWNRPHWSDEDLPWLDDFRTLVEPHRAAAGELPAGGDEWRRPFDESRLFSERSSAMFENVQTLAPDAFVALVASWSWVANLQDEARNEVLTQVRGLVGGEARLTLRYETEVQWARRR